MGAAGVLVAALFTLLAGPAAEASFTCQAVPGSNDVVVHSDRCEADVLALQSCTPGHAGAGAQSFFDSSYLDEVGPRAPRAPHLKTNRTKPYLPFPRK